MLEWPLLAQSSHWADQGRMAAPDPKRTFDPAGLVPLKTLLHLVSHFIFLVAQVSGGIHLIKAMQMAEIVWGSALGLMPVSYR
jgi:hypothetical protein